MPSPRRTALPALCSLLLLLSTGRDAAADALPYAGYKPPPCPPGSDWRAGGAGHRYCAPVACEPTPCEADTTCKAVELCLRPRKVAMGDVEEVVARDPAGCPAGATPRTERVCVASPAKPPGQRPSSGCGCRQSRSAEAWPLTLGAAAALLVVARRRGRGDRR